MSKLLYPIYKLPEEFMQNYEKRELPRYLKWWLYKRSLQTLSSILEGSNFILTNSANRYFKKFKVRGKTEQENNVITYKCNGTENGNYYFSYNNINYQFTMPEVTNGDILVFNTDTLVLSLDNTPITIRNGDNRYRIDIYTNTKSKLRNPL